MAEGVDHDQLFKEVIREFFPDFLRLFLPEQAKRFDLDRVAWIDKELFADPPDGPKHLLDLVAELTPRRDEAREKCLALIHVEIESADSVTDIERRLPDYYFHLRRTARKPVLPVVVFLKVGLDGLGEREIADRWFGEPILRLRYRYIGLPALPAETYLRGENWLGVALSALMKTSRELRIPFGTEAMRRLGESPLSDGKKSLLGDCVEAYIDLPEDESRRFHAILEANATGRVPPMNKTRVQIAREEGIEKGLAEGQLRGQRAAVTELLEARFGSIPSGFSEWLASQTSPEALRTWLIAAGTAPSFDEFRSIAGW